MGQVWTRHCRSSRACPTAFIALSLHHMFVRPMALLEFQSVLCPCLPGWGKSCGPRFWPLPPGVTAHCTGWGGGGGHHPQSADEYPSQSPAPCALVYPPPPTSWPGTGVRGHGGSSTKRCTMHKTANCRGHHLRLVQEAAPVLVPAGELHLQQLLGRLGLLPQPVGGFALRGRRARSLLLLDRPALEGGGLGCGAVERRQRRGALVHRGARVLDTGQCRQHRAG